MLRLCVRAFAVFLVAIPADAKPDRQSLDPKQPPEIRNLNGTYVLTMKGAGEDGAAARMKIWNQQGSTFLVGIAKSSGHPGIDWEGRGVIVGDRGYYDWVFPDGKKGRTTFTVDKDGRIHGQVRGGGIDWDYVGRRLEKPATR